MFPRLPGVTQLEVLLAADAYESAALALLGPEWGYMMSRGSGGVCLATVIAPGGDEDTTAQGATPALALMIALASALLGEGMQNLESVKPSRISSEAPKRS